MSALGLRRLALLSVGLILATAVGCTSMGASTARIIQDAVRGSSVSIPANLDQSPYRYLWARAGNSESLLVLGTVENAETDQTNPAQGPIEVWFTGNQEILRIQTGPMGRIVATTGLSVNWVRSSIRQTQAGWVRERDVMPGWKYGLVESLSRTQSKLVPRVARKHLRPEFIASNRAKTWWVEYSPQAPELGESVYAADANNGQVIAGYQCLAAEVCIAWERLGR